VVGGENVTHVNIIAATATDFGTWSDGIRAIAGMFS